MTDLALDEINKQIIEHLQRDGRMSYAALAKIIGLSEAAVRQRTGDVVPYPDVAPARFRGVAHAFMAGNGPPDE